MNKIRDARFTYSKEKLQENLIVSKYFSAIQLRILLYTGQDEPTSYLKVRVGIFGFSAASTYNK